MFENAPESTLDPIIVLMREYRADSRKNKLNLGIGVYKDKDGNTPIMQCVKNAEKLILENEDTKEYVSVSGDEGFLKAVSNYAFPNKTYGQDLIGIQSVGGSGALRLLIECAKSVCGSSTIWVTSPTWPNHFGIAAACDLEVKSFDYLDKNNMVDIDRIALDLSNAVAGDVILLHLCCHNPTGVDPSLEQISQIAQIVAAKGLIPIIDAAYIGFGDTFSNDIQKLMQYHKFLPELMLAMSFSKNFGIYRERTGAAFIFGTNPPELKRTMNNIYSIARADYSMPPDHGSRIVRTILETPRLVDLWEQELSVIRARIFENRTLLSNALRELAPQFSWDYINYGKGMFSMLPIQKEDADRIKSESAIYLMPSGRINLAGVLPERVNELARGITNAF